MSAQSARNMIAVLFVILILGLMLLLSGCHTFTLKTERCSAENVCTKVDLATRLESDKEVSVSYNAETKAYDINLGSAMKSQIDPFMGVVIQELLRMAQALTPVPQIPQENIND